MIKEVLLNSSLNIFMGSLGSFVLKTMFSFSLNSLVPSQPRNLFLKEQR